MDLSTNQRAVLDRQFGLIADKLATVDDLTTRVGAMEKTLGEVRALVLQLADGLHASRQNWREGIDSVKAIDGSLGNMVEDLAKDVAEMKGEIDIMRGEINVIQAWQGPSGSLLEVGDEDIDLEY